MLNEIRLVHEVNIGNIIIAPFTRNNIVDDSYVLSLDNKIYSYDKQWHDTSEYIDLNIGVEHKSLYIISDNGLLLYPGIIYECNTREIIGPINNFIPIISNYSEISKYGIVILNSGPVIINGTHLEIQFYVIRPIKIHLNMKICKIHFDTIT